MARRKSKLGKRNLAIGGGLIIVIFVMIVSFPSITNVITGGNDSTEFRFAFPDISELTPAILIGGQDTARISGVDCFFKFTLVAKDSSGRVIEIRQAGFAGGTGGVNPFTTFSIATVTTGATGSESVVGGRVIDRYEIIPKLRCDRTQQGSDEQQFESGLLILPSPIKLTTSVLQPDGKLRNLADRSLTIQSIGADDDNDPFNRNNWVIIVRAEDFFGFIPNIFYDAKKGVLRDNTEIEFKGTLGQLKSANEFFTIPASAINNIAKAQLETYNTEIIFTMTGNLNADYIFLSSDKTQVVPVSGLTKKVIINVDRIQDVPASEFPQSIILTSAITNSGKCLAGFCGSNKNLNPDIASDRAITVIAELENFQGANVEGLPTLTLKKTTGATVSGISGGNPKLMSFVSGDRFTASMTLPSSIADAYYVFQVTSQIRSVTGSGGFQVVTPPPDAPEIPTCDNGQVLDANDVCVNDPTNGGDNPQDPKCGAGQQLIEGQCIDVFCADGTPAIDGCLIKPVIGGQCLQGQTEELDGTCTNPLCPSGTEYDQSTQKCIPIDCGTGLEFDDILKECVKPPSGTTECKFGEKRLEGICVPIGTEAGEGNVLNIRQELRYRLLTSDQSGLNTPVQSGVIPEDQSLFAGLTQLQFLAESPSKDLVKFDRLEVDSFLILPQRLASVDLTVTKLNQKINLYHNNVILQNGITKNPDEPALVIRGFPSGTFGVTNTGVSGGFFALGNMAITTSDLFSAITGGTGAFNCFEAGDVCTTIGGQQLTDGDRISLMYVVDGEFDLTTGIGDELKEFDGTIGQMRYWTNLIYTDKVLSGDECIGLAGKELLRCNFKRDGINPLADVCDSLEEFRENTNNPDATEQESFDSCLNAIDDRTIGAIQNSICEDSDKLAGFVELTNTGDKSTEEILANLKSAFGCECKLNEKLENGQCVMKSPDEIDTFVCPAGTEAISAEITPSTVDDCEVKDPCKKDNIEGGKIETKPDGTFICVIPPIIDEKGEPQCQSGSTRDPTTGQCTYDPEKEDAESLAGINALFKSLADFLQSFTTNNNPSVTTTGSDGQTNNGGACTENILNCFAEIFLGGDDEPMDIIPPALQIGGSSTNTLILIFAIIIAVLIIGVIIRRRRG